MNNKVIQPLRLNVERFKREYKRLEGMTTFQRAMDKAIDAKADKWMAYTPLSKAQLFDDEFKNITIVSTLADGQLSASRSTRRGSGWHTQYTVLSRPTEVRAILHASGFLVLESDFVVVRQETNRQVRYCITCKKHHEVADFVSHNKYLNGLSYACKSSLRNSRGGLWRKAS